MHWFCGQMLCEWTNCLTGNGVLRRPSFEEKYLRTSSPAGSDVPGGSSRSDSPSTAFWDSMATVHAADNTDIHTAFYRANVSRDADIGRLFTAVTSRDMVTSRDTVTSRDADALLMAGRPFVAVTSRTRSPAVVSSRPVSGPPRQFITSPPAITVPSGSSYSPAMAPTQAQPSILTATSSLAGVSAAAVPVSAPNGFQIAAASVLLPAQLGYATSPLDCRRDVTVTSSALPCAAPVTSARSSRAPAVVLQQVHSCEVAWPSAQRATVPLLHDTDDIVVADTRDIAESVMSACRDITVTCHVTPATVMSSSVSFAPPYDRSTRYIVNVSPLPPLSAESLSATESLSQLSADSPPPSEPPTLPDRPPTLSDKPPPPYPGRAALLSPRALRPVPPPPQDTDIDIEPELSAGPAADDSTDEDVAVTTECQRFESPKPVRRAGDELRCETNVCTSA